MVELFNYILREIVSSLNNENIKEASNILSRHIHKNSGVRRPNAQWS
jgi:hypothetical protein